MASHIVSLPLFHCFTDAEGLPDVTGNTYSSILTVQEVTTCVAVSCCPKTGEPRILGTLAGVHLDSANDVTIDIPSSNHDPVLEFNGTCSTENEEG